MGGGFILQEQARSTAARVPALRDEPAHERGDYRVRLDGDPGSGDRCGEDFQAFTAADRDAVLAKTEAAAKAGEFEKYKTSNYFDGTARNPQWLG